MHSESGGKPTSVRGARDQKLKLSDRWHSYTSHHKTTFRDAFKKMIFEPAQTLMTVMVIAIALALPSALLLALQNVQQLGGGIEASSQLTVYVNKQAEAPQIKKLQQQISALPGVAAIDYISSDQALVEFEELSGFGQALQYLDDNPLPAAFVVKPDSLSVSAHAKDLVVALQSFDYVSEVQVDMLWLERLSAMTDIGKKLVLAIGLAFVAGVVLVIGNTIRLSIENRKEEIIVVKLIGATDAYVRRPFLYSGFLLGFFGGLNASVLLLVGSFWIGQSVTSLVALYSSGYSVIGLNVTGVLGLCMVGSMIGLCGAWLAVMQHLRAIQPR
jgi:cell division transport system permease protein